MLCIRHARQSDERGILACLAAAFEPYRTQYTDVAFADTVLSPDRLRERMSAMEVFVAETDGHVVGTVAVANCEAGSGRLRGMAVLPEWHGKGIARRLVGRALDELLVTGCGRATLGTTPPLVRAAHFYRSAGFAPTGAVRDFHGVPLEEHERLLDTSVTIRDANPEDASEILRIVNAAYVVERDFVTGDRLDDADLRAHLERGGFLIAERQGRPRACVFLQRTATDRMYLGLLAVDPVEQRRGLGRLMMASAERRCRADGIGAIDILIVNHRTELPAFYGSRGFVPTGTRPFEDARLTKPAHFIAMTLPL